MKRCIAVILILALFLCGCLNEDVNDFNLTSYTEDVYITLPQSSSLNNYSSTSAKKKTTANKSTKTSKVSNTTSKEDKTISFNKTPEFNNVGKSFSDIYKQNPNLVFNPTKVEVLNGVAQILGEKDGDFAYYFYSRSKPPFLKNIYNDGCADSVNCTGVFTTVGRVFKNTTDNTTPKELFKDLGISDYNYTSNNVLEPGFIKFDYKNYQIIISYFEELDKNLIYDNKTELDIPPQYIKSSYPVVIIDKTVNDGNGVDKWLSNNDYWYMRVINMKNKKLFSTFDIILSGLFIALFTIGAYVRIPVFGVPFTLQLFFVLLAGQILKWYMAAFSVISYIVLGLLGLPVFAGGGGVGYALTPSFGYLLGFVLCAAIISLFPKNISLTKLIFKNILGVILVYAFAIIYTCLLTLFYFNKPHLYNL